MVLNAELGLLQTKLNGDLLLDDLNRKLYATDASVYRIVPLAVAVPKTISDIKQLVAFANTHNTSLIPRTAGTSLAGQCVGQGIVVDMSTYFTKIIDLDIKKKTVAVQPGVVRDTLNNLLKPYGLWFSPNTSTSNRCMIGGMVGNNSSGTTSIKYGVTRDKVLALKTILSDGSEVEFKSVSREEFQTKCEGTSLESNIYKTIHKCLKSKKIQDKIVYEFPKSVIHRKNTGYAIDELINTNAFHNSTIALNLNLCKLLSGSEGTLAFTTEILLQLDDLPPSKSAIAALHFNSIKNCMKAIKMVMKHDLYTCEMVDNTILNLTKYNKTQQINRTFIEGEPVALLLCELRADTEHQLKQNIKEFLDTVKKIKLSYAAPILCKENILKAVELRKAGLGLLGNMIGDKKAVACIEDTAVDLEDLEPYIFEFTELMKKHQQKAVYYGHAGAGELHLRPILNLKNLKDVTLFRTITTEVAQLVKKYKGSMSGEHGDGIVRSEFIPLLIGSKNYAILKNIKFAFDPNNIFNPGKIVDPLQMDKNLRYKTNRTAPKINTIMDFSLSKGILREAEKCNGSGDCRKTAEFGGTMCPSYRATRNEKDTTRARANALRDYLTHSNQQNKFNYKALKIVFDLCLSCKACATECPSSVDVAALKAEFLYQYQKDNRISLRSKLFAYNNTINAYVSLIPRISNYLFKNKLTSYIIKVALGIAKQRSLPQISDQCLYKIVKNNNFQKENIKFIKTVYFFNDEFTNYLDTSIGLDAITLLGKLNYCVKIVDHKESGRAMISKGFLDEAKKMANKNIAIFKNFISQETPLIGIEPSAILTFRDEYIKLVDDKTAARKIAKHTFLIEEFLQNEIELGNIDAKQFTSNTQQIKFHGHCYQKALANQKSSFDILNLPKNYKVTIIPSGCCGMAGSFGYEKEHFDVSMAVGGQTLFPAIKKATKSTIIAANGTSCRHQIKDGTGKIAKHPITILKEALIN